MAWVLHTVENEGQDKHVESVCVPCLDAGSNPAISTLLRIGGIFLDERHCCRHRLIGQFSSIFVNFLQSGQSNSIKFRALVTGRFLEGLSTVSRGSIDT